jgi:hypothetical protein
MIDMNAPTRGIPARALLVVLSSFFALAACGRIPGQFVILNDQIPLSGCLFPTNVGVYMGTGAVDLEIVRQGAETAYFVFPLLENNLAASTGGIDANQITLTGFNVDISAISGAGPQTADVLASNPGLTHYQVPWSGSIGSGGSKVSAVVNALPVALAQAILGTQEVDISPTLNLDLRVSALGHTPTQDIESDPLDFPITVCAGCLIANVQPCPYTSMLSYPGNPCNAAQDAPVDCCISGADLICPGTVVMK